MVLTTAGISVRGRSRQGAEDLDILSALKRRGFTAGKDNSIGNRKLEILTCSMG